MLVPSDGRRRHRLAIYSTARKNGKSALAAGIGLAALTTEQQGGQVIGAAADRDQARLIWNHAKQMVTQDPVLSEEIKVYAHVLEHRESQSVYRSISSEAYTKEGLSPSLVIIDELHAFPTRELFDVLSLAQGARRDPLMLVTTTAGVMSTRTEDESILFQLYQYGLRIIRGEIEDPTFFMAWWGADEESDHLDEANWELANPGLDDIVDREDMRSAVRRTPESEFRIKRTNAWVAVEDFWLPAGAWDACAGRVELDVTLPICVGIDIALTNDASAVVIAQKQGDKVAVKARVWQNPHQDGTIAHKEWRMPLDEIVGYMRTLRTLYPKSAVKINDIAAPGPAYVYDKWGLASHGTGAGGRTGLFAHPGAPTGRLDGRSLAPLLRGGPRGPHHPRPGRRVRQHARRASAPCRAPTGRGKRLAAGKAHKVKEDRLRGGSRDGGEPSPRRSSQGTLSGVSRLKPRWCACSEPFDLGFGLCRACGLLVLEELTEDDDD